MFLGGGQEVQYRNYAEQTQHLIDKEVARLLREAEERAQKLLNENREHLDQLTALLLERETVDGESVYRIVGRPVPGGQPQVLKTTASG
jgi:cell division protease FtsH